jgi:hypothetical protein
MLLSRRQVVGGGVTTAAFCALSTPAFAQSAARTRPDRLSDLVINEVDAPRPAPAAVPARPRTGVDPFLDQRMVARARAAFDRHRASLSRTETVGIVDFTKPSAESRFYLLDTNSGRITRHLVAHGRGSDPSHTGFLQHFSNRMGSEASSNGAYVTGDYYPGRYGRSMRVRGLDYSNSNAEARAIVVHSAWYAEPNMLASNNGMLGRSEGCFALPYNSLQEILTRLGPGHFLYADRLA